MTEPFVGQLCLFPFGFAPRGWAVCNGQMLGIAQNQALFSLLGTQFGGDGQTTFALPNLQGRVCLGTDGTSGSTYKVGAVGGEATHTLTIGETPAHTHALEADATTPATSNVTAPAGNVLGQSMATGPDGSKFSMEIYTPSGPNGNQLASAAIGTVGGQPHQNMMPSLGLNYCIALQGIFPSRS